MLDLTCGPCIYKRIAGCGSGTEYLAVTPWGDLYPCHQFVGDEAYKMGSIYDGVRNLELRDKFASCNAYSRPECKDCWAVPAAALLIPTTLQAISTASTRWAVIYSARGSSAR